MKFLFLFFNLLISNYIYANNLFVKQDLQKDSILFAYNFPSSGWKESDISSEINDLNDDIITQINSNKTEDFNSELSNSQIESEIFNLNSTENLDSIVNKQLNTENGHLLNDVLPNNNSQLIQSHYDFAKVVAKHTKEQLNSLISNLKQSNDIDCKQYHSIRVSENNFTLRTMSKTENHIADEPFFCEHLRSQYNCKDEMEIHCLQFSHKPEDIRITSTNFKYDVKKEIMTMRHDYKPNVTSKVARDSWFENGAIAYKKHLRKYDLSETNLIMTFDIRIEPKVFDEFNLYNVSYTGFILITLNDQVVYSAPYGGNNLYSKNYNQEILIRTDSFPLLYKTEYFDLYPVISTGSNSYNLGQNGNSNQKNIQTIDLRPYLRLYNNTLIIKGLSAGNGFVQAQMKSYERQCLKWSEEKWNESCTLLNN